MQEIAAQPGTVLAEHITTINSCYPEEIVRYGGGREGGGGGEGGGRGGGGRGGDGGGREGGGREKGGREGVLHVYMYITTINSCYPEEIVRYGGRERGDGGGGKRREGGRREGGGREGGREGGRPTCIYVHYNNQQLLP